MLVSALIMLTPVRPETPCLYAYNAIAISLMALFVQNGTSHHRSTHFHFARHIAHRELRAIDIALYSGLIDQIDGTFKLHTEATR